MTAVPPAAPKAAPGIGGGQHLSASMVNSFRVSAVAERLATHTQPGGGQHQDSEFIDLCLSLARGIDYAIANNEVPPKAQELPLLLKQIRQHRNDLSIQAAIMVLMISVKNACKMSWFSDRESQELFNLANEVGNCFCSPEDINHELDGSRSTVLEVMSRFYPSMKMGQILASIEAKPGYGALVVDFHISKNTTHSPNEKIRLFVAQKDNIETSACIISPQQVNFLLNGKGVERRTNVLMDPGPQMPTNVTAMLKYGTNLLQAVGQFSGHYVIVIAFMSIESSPGASTLPDYVQSSNFAPDSEDSELIEGPSRISLKCPISRTRIKTPVKGHACKHLQCFDFDNYVEINSRRPSWRCPHCNQHVCYTNIRVDQNMAKVFKEVAEDVSDVIISAEGSWKAVMVNDDDVDEKHDKNLNGQKDGSEQLESSTGVPVVMDLTQTDTDVDAMDIIEIEDRKPDLVNTAGTNQNAASHMEDNFWAELYLSTGVSIPSTSRTDTQVGGRSDSTPNLRVSPVFSDAISPAPNRADAPGNANPTTPRIQNQVATANNLHLQPSQVINPMSNNEYGNLQNIPRLNRMTAAVQALPAVSQTQTPTPQMRSGNSMNTMSSNNSPRLPAVSQTQTPTPQMRSGNSMNTMSSNNSPRLPAVSQTQTPTPQMRSGNSMNTMSSNSSPRLPAVSQTQTPTPQMRSGNSMNTMSSNSSPRTPVTQHQRQFSQPVQQVGVAAPSQLPGPYRPSGFFSEYQNAHLQQALNTRLSQPRSPSPGLMRSPSPMLRVQAQQGAAQAGRGYAAVNVNNPSRFMAASQRTTQMARQPPMVAVQTQIPRAPSYPVNIGGLAPPAAPESASEQDWRPTGRMRGSLTGRQYNEDLRQMMIQPTQSNQAARPQTNLTSPPSVPPQFQAFLANSRNAVNPQVTETTAMNGNSGVLPEKSSGMH